MLGYNTSDIIIIYDNDKLLISWKLLLPYKNIRIIFIKDLKYVESNHELNCF